MTRVLWSGSLHRLDLSLSGVAYFHFPLYILNYLIMVDSRNQHQGKSGLFLEVDLYMRPTTEFCLH